MLNDIYEYKLNRRKQMIFIIIYLAIAIPLISVSISGIIEANREISFYESDGSIITGDSNPDELFRHMLRKRAIEQRDNATLLTAITILALLGVLHFSFFTNAKLVLDKNGIKIYSIYQKEPDKFFSWQKIKSIQIGYIYAPGGRFTQYSIKIRYVEIKNSKEEYANETIPIKRFNDYDILVKNLENLGGIENVEVFHMNDD